MNIMKPSFEILTPISDGGIEELKHIERIGRVCYKSEDKISEDGETAKKFVKMLIDRGHEAMIEHSSLSVKFTVDRGVSHELVRHRIASFAQESTRYVNYSLDKFGNEINVIDINGGIELDAKMNGMPDSIIDVILHEWIGAMKDAEKHYMRMIELGATPQIARSVLPNSTKTEITITANYREWRNFFKLRTANTAHPSMREVTIPLLKELKDKLPIIFDDIKVVEWFKISRKENKYIELDDEYLIELYFPNSNEVDDYAHISKIDYENCKKIFWRKSEYGYARGYLNGKEILLHKYITNTSSDTLIDHKDRNKLNCVRNNLRYANKSINSLNRNVQKNSITGYKGVSFDKRRNKYRAYLKKNGKQIWLGYYNNIEDAIIARKNGFNKIFGKDIYVK